MVDQDLSGVASVAGLVSRYGTVNVRALKPSMGRDGLGFAMGRSNGVHFKLNTIGKMNRTTMRDVVRRHGGGNPFLKVFSFIRHIGLGTYGGGGVRYLTLTNKFSDFSRLGHRRCFTTGSGNRLFLRALVHCNGHCRTSGTTTIGSLFKNRGMVSITAPRVPRKIRH